MDLKSIFRSPVTRPIEGVIKADDEASLYTELDEYVLTDEIAKRLDDFLEGYTNYQGANGVWISGFFGSGKSHLLKILALLLENREVDGRTAYDLFAPKVPDDDEFLRAQLKKAVAIPSRSILFNIDQKADIISKTQTDALLSVFVKVFNEACGYYGKQGYIAQFERDLDSRDQLAAFKTAYANVASKPWERGREQALLESRNIARAYAQATGNDEADAKGILDKYRTQYSVSIEDFSNQVKAWLDTQPDDFRLNFFVDEVGQYIADSTKLMTNLQTVAESLATKCKGRAWIVVTAQEDMTDVLGDMDDKDSTDFSKIQARFANRLKLTSADVAEVIQKRLLTKNNDGQLLLHDVYNKQYNNFKTLFDFADGAQQYRNFQDEEHFTYCYPFVPYQFPLFQAAIRGLSQHNGFEGKANSVGERSMLGVFRDVAIAIQDDAIGKLATFDSMFEGIRSALKGNIQNAINTAEHHLGDPYAVRVLKALFLVKYVKEFKPTIHNIGVLMLERFDENITAQHQALEAALNKLETQTYIQRTGNTYEYLTDEEKDIEQEIKLTEVDNTDIAKTLQEMLFDGAIKQRKIRHTNGQDYPYTRKMDGRAFSREYELALHLITPMHDSFDSLEVQRMQSMQQDELRVVLPADARFMADLTLYKRTEIYVKQNSNTQQDSVYRILESKSFQNNDRYTELQQRAKDLLARATLIVNAADIDVSGSDGQTRVVNGFHQLIETTYPNLRMLRTDITYAENELDKWFNYSQNSLFTDDIAKLTEPEQELLSYIQGNGRQGLRTSVKTVLEHFGRKPYGWYYAATLCNLALLCARGKLEVRRDSNVLDGDDLEKALRNTQAQANLILQPQVEYSASQLRGLKDFFSDFFSKPPQNNEARALARETVDELKAMRNKLARLHEQKDRYPFVASLGGVLQSLDDTAAKDTDWFFTKLPGAENALLDTKEQLIDPLQHFMRGPQKAIYDDARDLLRDEKDNLTYVPSSDVQPIRDVLAASRPWENSQLQQLQSRLDDLRRDIKAEIDKATADSTAILDELQQRLTKADGYDQLDSERQAQLAQAFGEARQDIQSLRSIAVIRNMPQQFKRRKYLELLSQLQRWTQRQPEPVNGNGSNKHGQDGQPTPADSNTKVAESQVIAAAEIRVDYDKPWLSTTVELDNYVQKLRDAWQKEIEAGKQIQI